MTTKELYEITSNYKLMQKDIDYIKEDIGDLKTSVKEIFNKMDRFIETADAKYASKSSVVGLYKAGYWVNGIICTSVVVAILNLVID